MRGAIKFIAIVLTVALFLSGCDMYTPDRMYHPPKRSEEYNNLQREIDRVMSGLSYHAPVAGENQQTVQMADLDGDGEDEYIVFAKGDAEKPLKILIFSQNDGTYTHTDTIDCNGASFDQVEYVQMDDMRGVELVVGARLSDQLVRSVSVYKLIDGQIKQIVTTNYTKFLTADLDSDGFGELFILRPGITDSDNGIAELYAIKNGLIERSNEVDMSESSGKLKRLITGKLHGGQTAVYAASTVDDKAIITDVFAVKDGKLANISFSSESGTSVQTIRNYYIYADDIDNDGVVELPDLIEMTVSVGSQAAEKHDLIRWYAMTPDGTEVTKMYTYHNFIGGWYIHLDDQWASQLMVRNYANKYEFYLWGSDFESSELIFTVYTLTGQTREEEAISNSRFVINRTESVIFAGKLEQAAHNYDLTEANITRSFHMIQHDWKTGET